MIVEQFVYAQGGRAVQKTIYDNGAITYQDVGAAPGGSNDGQVLSVQVDGQGIFGGNTGGGGGIFSGTPFGGAPIVNQGFNLFGTNSPVSLAPLLHSPAAWVTGLAILAAVFAGRQGAGGGRRSPGYF